MKRVIGLDLSLTATGVSVSDGGITVLKTKLKGHDRLDWIWDQVGRAARIGERPGAETLVVVEGPSFGSQGSAYHQLAGLWWLVAHGLHVAEVPYVVVSPRSCAASRTWRSTTTTPRTRSC